MAVRIDNVRLIDPAAQHDAVTSVIIENGRLMTGSAGMTAAEVLAAMKHKPQRQETSTHLGLEIQRLVWTHWTSGSTYQVVLVAGRLVSKSNEIKPLIG